MLNRQTSLPHSLLIGGLALVLLTVPSPGWAEVLLYKLNTVCSIKGADPLPCRVQAVDEGEATLYTHQIGATTETIRITDAPIRMTRRIVDSEEWVTLQQAGARLSTNTICFNGLDLCVVNPNYLNSITQDSPAAMEGRDLVRVFFGEAVASRPLQWPWAYRCPQPLHPPA